MVEFTEIAVGDEDGVKKINENFDEARKQFAGNSDTLSELKNIRPKREKIQTVSVTNGGTFTPVVDGQLVVTVTHNENANWALCTVKTAEKFSGKQHTLYSRQAWGRFYDVTTILVYAGETIQFELNNTSIMTMTADFIPLK